MEWELGGYDARRDPAERNEKWNGKRKTKERKKKESIERRNGERKGVDQDSDRARSRGVHLGLLPLGSAEPVIHEACA